VFMGGAAGIGNATASAEFNIWTDPEAAAIVLNAAGELDIPLTMYGLDVFYDVEITLEEARKLIATGEKSAVAPVRRPVAADRQVIGMPGPALDGLPLAPMAARLHRACLRRHSRGVVAHLSGQAWP
jgi:hypothetical protein